MNTVIKTILSRRSVRDYLSDPISEKDLETILTAGSYAPNAMGTQSFRFTMIANQDVLLDINERIRRTLATLPVTDKTSPYLVSLIQKAENGGVDFLYHAPAYVLASDLKENPNGMADCALALGNMMLAAHSLGISSCWLNQLRALCDIPTMREFLSNFKIPENHKVFGSVVFGFPADIPQEPKPRENVFNIYR